MQPSWSTLGGGDDYTDGNCCPFLHETATSCSRTRLQGTFLRHQASRLSAAYQICNASKILNLWFTLVVLHCCAMLLLLKTCPVDPNSNSYDEACKTRRWCYIEYEPSDGLVHEAALIENQFSSVNSNQFFTKFSATRRRRRRHCYSGSGSGKGLTLCKVMVIVAATTAIWQTKRTCTHSPTNHR